MNNRFFKSMVKPLLIAGSAMAIFNCGTDVDALDPTNTPATANSSVYIVDEPSFLFDDGIVKYLISTSGSVKDTLGNKVGVVDFAGGIIYISDANGQAIAVTQGLDFNTLPTVMPTKVNADGWALKVGNAVYVIYQNGFVADAEGNAIGTFAPVAGMVGNVVDASGAILIANVDLNSLKTVTANTSNGNNDNPIASSASNGNDTPIVTSSNGNNDYPIVTSSAVTQVSSASNLKSSASTTRSSSSTAKSSSSKAASSSSVATTGGCPTIKYVNGGASGSGWATRYWDCCKPSCSWAENSGGNMAKQCDAKGNKISDPSSTSMCNGGNAGTCVSQIPFTIDGCTTYGFAFAAVPASNGGQCGHCYELTFTGEGHYSSTNSNTKKLKTEGKKLIVMASNIGGDVSQGQFDVMIPGGGTGIFDGCSSRMGWGPQGEQYGGLLSECEKENNYSAAKYKSCLTKKCESSFSSDPVAKEGCLFLANWMNSAGNPEHTYKEVECPDVLKNKY